MKRCTRVLLILTIILMATCEGLDRYAEYRGVNLVDSDLSEWTIRERSPIDYLTAAEVAPSEGVAAPISGAAVYRLEIPNLVRNGDFEATELDHLPDGWTAENTAWGKVFIEQYPADNIDYLPIQGKTLSFHTMTFANRIFLDLKSPTSGLRDQCVAGGQYLLGFKYNIPVSMSIEFSNGIDAVNASSRVLSQTEGTIVQFPFQYSESVFTSEGWSQFSINSFNAENAGTTYGSIDDLRLYRIDIDNVLFHIEAIEETGRLKLEPGNYVFSVWVRLDTATTPGVPNRYTAQAFSLRMSVLDADSQLEKQSLEVFSIGTSDVWTQVSIEVSFDALAGQFLELAVTPMDIMNTAYGHGGSMLMAAPKLEFVSF